MIIEQTKHRLDACGLTNIQAMQINVSAHAFNLLIDTQYTDIISSIIRELVSNAIDASRETQIPVEVSLPTTFEPELIIKDYGTGIPTNQFVEIYGTLFSSTKQHTNDYIGGFGLGCKCPLAYVPVYTVENRIDHIKHTYAIFKDEHGIPQISRTNSSPTNEPAGLTIRIPIAQDDIPTFQDKANKILYWFGERVKTNIELPQYECLWTGQHGILIKNLEHGCYALLGTVLYKIDTYNSFVHLGLTPRLSNNWINALILKFNIGDLSITPNREELLKTETNTQAITNAYKNAIDELRTDTIAQANEEQDLIEAYKKILPQYAFLKCLAAWPSHAIHLPTHQPLHPDQAQWVDAEPTWTVRAIKPKRKENGVTTMNITTKLQIPFTRSLSILWAPPGTKHIKQRIAYTNPLHPDGYLILANTLEEVQALSKLSINGFEYIDLRDYDIETTKKPKQQPLELLNTQRERITLSSATPFYWVENPKHTNTIKTFPNGEPLIPYVCLNLLQTIKPNETLYLVPPSKLKTVKNLPHATHILEGLTELIKHHTPNPKNIAANALHNALDNRSLYAIRHAIDDISENPSAFSTRLNTLIQHLKKTNNGDDTDTRLFEKFNLPYPTNPTLEEYFKTELDFYTPVLFHTHHLNTPKVQRMIALYEEHAQ